MNINNELINLIDKYDIGSCYPNYKKYQECKKKIIELFNNLRNYNVGIIYVNYIDKRELIEYIKDYENFLDDYIFDNDAYENLDEIDVSKYDYLIFASFENRHKWFEKILQKEYDGVFIDLYDYLESKQLHCDTEYYRTGSFLHDGYGEIFYNKLKFKNQKGKLKELFLQRLIFDYLDIRDFKYAEKYINIYIENEYQNYKKYKEFNAELQRFLNEIRICISNRKYNDIIWNWIDALRDDEVECMEYLSEIKDKSIVFNNSYTVSPWTIPTYYTLFEQKMMVEDNFLEYRNHKISKDSNLIKIINQHGYSFERFGILLNIFEDEINNDMVQETNGFAFDKGKFRRTKDFQARLKKHRDTDCKEEICPMLLWKTLVSLVENDVPQVILRHIDVETHTPYVSGNIDHDYINDQFNPKTAQIPVARTYVDEQLKYYDQFFSKKISCIYMSDHGKNKKDVYHTVLMIKNDFIVPKKYDEIFSYIKFAELLKKILEKNYNFTELFSESAKIQDLDRYGANWKLNIDSNNIKKNNMLGYQGVHTENEIFMLRNDGKEFYYRLPSELDLISDEVYTDNVKRLRDLTSDYKLDVYKYEGLQETRIIYRAMELSKDEMQTKQNKIYSILREFLYTIPHEKVCAIRGGGQHTVELMKLLKSFSNIKYIIDKNKKVFGVIPKCQYVEIKDKVLQKVDFVFVSSFKYRKQMTRELREYLPNCKVIDLYSVLEDNGITLDCPFYEVEEIIPSEVCKKVIEEMEK